MSYLLDIYYGKIEPSHSVSEYVCYLVYFPKLIAGPIVRAADFLPQFSRSVQITAQDVEIGCAYLLVGAVKKLVIADQLASHVSMILGAPQHYNAFTLLQGLIGYTVQIYADFSGYSDMAIGCARLMGIRFPQNFLMPYSSVNIAEFWRRWHVTMSSWFRDYVFLPLEMASRDMRNTNVRASRNVILTMLLCGLWHGASWNFVAWGGLHGVALAVYQVYTSARGRQVRRGARSAFHPGTLAARALTLSVVMVAYILFGTQTLTMAFTYLMAYVDLEPGRRGTRISIHLAAYSPRSCRASVCQQGPQSDRGDGNLFGIDSSRRVCEPLVGPNLAGAVGNSTICLHAVLRACWPRSFCGAAERGIEIGTSDFSTPQFDEAMQDYLKANAVEWGFGKLLRAQKPFRVKRNYP